MRGGRGHFRGQGHMRGQGRGGGWVGPRQQPMFHNNMNSGPRNRRPGK